MGIEIERRFLIKNNDWKKEEDFSEYCSWNMKQGYLSVDPERVVRVRTQKHTGGFKALGFITVKGMKKNNACAEYESYVEIDDAEAMLKMCISTLSKKRYELWDTNGQEWFIDVFKGPLKGVVIAEIELSDKKEKIILPSWVDEEITTDHAYSNLSLSQFGLPHEPITQ